MQNKLVFFLFSALLLSSCEDEPIVPETTFEKKDILVNLSDNLIVPYYEDLDQKIDSLDLSWNLFLTNPDQVNFESVKNNWKKAYISFQNVKFIDFGPAMENSFPLALGTFPSDTIKIQDNISAASYDLNSMENSGSIGFSALDYLFFKDNALAEIQSEAARRTYISDVIQKMKNEINFVVSGWTAYRETFIDGSGTSTTSPFSQLVNSFCKDFELAKNTKLGIPLGKQSLGIQRLEYLEAPYAKIGKELLLENVKALQAVYKGGSGIGFDDYLLALERGDLNTTIQNRFDYLVSNPGTWLTDLKAMMLNSTAIIDDYYIYMHNSVVYVKTDMTSSFGVLITYQDNDGD